MNVECNAAEGRAKLKREGNSLNEVRTSFSRASTANANQQASFGQSLHTNANQVSVGRASTLKVVEQDRIASGRARPYCRWWNKAALQVAESRRNIIASRILAFKIGKKKIKKNQDWSNQYDDCRVNDHP